LAVSLGGEAVELRGDGALIAFSEPFAGFECATLLQRACTRAGEISIRVGLHAGRALQLEHGYFGQALILASRIADHAQPGEILMSAQLLASLGATPPFEVSASRPVSLKGFPEPVLVCCLEWSADARRTYRDVARTLLARPSVAEGGYGSAGADVR